MSKIYIETPRLRLRGWEPRDIDTFASMNSDPQVMKYFPSTLNYRETVNLYERIQKEFSLYDFGLFAAEEKLSKEFMGFIGFHHADAHIEFCPCIEIGWRLDKKFWNKGYGTEGAKACLEYGFKTLDFDEVYSFTSKINIPSQKVMKNIGMEFYTDFEYPTLGEKDPLRPHVCYRAVR